MPTPSHARAHPAHADPWPTLPRLTPRAERAFVSAIVIVGLGLLAGAGTAAHRAGAAPVAPATSVTSSSAGVASGEALGTGLPSMTPPVAAPLVPPVRTSPGPSAPPSGPVVADLAADGIPLVALDAYRRAASESTVRYPACGLPWPLLAAIGRVESDHGRFGDSQLHADGTSAPRIIGIPLNGSGTALIRDTDGGRLDGDTVYDRAVGPMQFIPSTWAKWGVDGNGDHIVSPFNIFDAAAAAANYLCAAGGNLRTSAGQISAILAYNHSDAYLSLVLALEKLYAAGVPGVTIPITGSNPAPAPGERPVLPPVNPGPPLGLSGSGSSTSPSPSRTRSPTPTPTHTPSPSPRPTATAFPPPGTITSTSPTPSPSCTPPTSTSPDPSATTTPPTGTTPSQPTDTTSPGSTSSPTDTTSTSTAASTQAGPTCPPTP